MRKNAFFLEIFIPTLFIGIFRFFPYITLVIFFCFQATGHSFSCRNMIFGLRESCTIGNDGISVVSIVAVNLHKNNIFSSTNVFTVNLHENHIISHFSFLHYSVVSLNTKKGGLPVSRRCYCTTSY